MSSHSEIEKRSKKLIPFGLTCLKTLAVLDEAVVVAGSTVFGRAARACFTVVVAFVANMRYKKLLKI